MSWHGLRSLSARGGLSVNPNQLASAGNTRDLWPDCIATVLPTGIPGIGASLSNRIPNLFSAKGQPTLGWPRASNGNATGKKC